MVDLAEEDANIGQRAMLEHVAQASNGTADLDRFMNQASPPAATAPEEAQGKILLSTREPERPPQNFALDRHSKARMGMRVIASAFSSLRMGLSCSAPTSPF